MHAYPSQMRSIGNRLAAIAEEARGNADAVVGDAEKAGVGNEGFTTVAQAAASAEDWFGHVRKVAGHVQDAGEGLVTAADDIEGTDLDNEKGMPDPETAAA